MSLVCAAGVAGFISRVAGPARAFNCISGELAGFFFLGTVGWARVGVLINVGDRRCLFAEVFCFRWVREE